MKKQYTKKQIVETISYWQEQLKMMDEAVYETTIDDAIRQLQSFKKDYGGGTIVKIRSFDDNNPIYDDIYKIESIEYPEGSGKQIVFIS